RKMDRKLADENMESFLEEKAQQLFLLSDQERKGFIVKRDMQRMRSEVPLSPEQLEAVFDSLDVNNNGYLTIEQFLSGFGEYIASHSKKAWDSEEVMESAQTDGQETMECLFQELEAIKIINNIGMLRQLCHDVNAAPHLEMFLQQLVADLKRCQDEQRNLEEALRLKDEEHKAQVRRLFEEMESQLHEDKKIRRMQEEQILRLKRDNLEREMDEKEQQLQEALNRQQELADRKELEQDLEAEHREVVQLQHNLSDVRQNEEWERRKHLSAGFTLAKRIMLEQQGLMHQLTLLQKMATTLEREDEEQQTEVSKTSQDESAENGSLDPSLLKCWKKRHYNPESEDDFYEGTELVTEQRRLAATR
ncbi:hypothetical protein L9F63_025085, partial [Diploptera punctata]